MHRLIVIIVIIASSATYCWAQTGVNKQPEAYENMDFFYIENSEVAKNNGLDIKLLDLFNEKLDSASKRESNKLLVYISDGADSRVTDKQDDITSFINSIYERRTVFPNVKSEDRNRINNFLYDQPFKIEKKMNFHFFVSDWFVESSLNEIPLLTGLLPKDILLDFGTSDTEAIVTLYFKNDGRIINKDDILRHVRFSNRLIDNSKSVDLTCFVY